MNKLTVLAALALTVTACEKPIVLDFEDPEPSPQGEGSPSGVGGPCQSKSNCAAGDICYTARQDVEGDLGFCSHECETGADCGAGSACIGGICLLTCASKDDCSNPGTTCKDVGGKGVCWGRDGYLGDVCQWDNWCGQTETGKCTFAKGDDLCTGDACQTNKADLKTGICTSYCVSSVECSSDSACDGNRCFLKCDGDQDCRLDGKYSACLDGLCKPLPPATL